MKKRFIGYTNIKWLIKELIATCSDEKSYFSKKRIQAWILFDTAIITMVWWFCENNSEMEIFEMLEFAGILFLAAGYQIRTIQQEKKFNKKL
jgi:hypothetical protein